MKLFKLPIKIVLILTWFLIATNSVRSQSGNMSDVTMPNPGEVNQETPGDDEVVNSDPATEDTAPDEVADSDPPTEDTAPDEVADSDPPTEDTVSNDSDAADRNEDNANVMEAIAESNESETNVETNEDDFGANLGGNTAGDIDVTVDDNVIPDTAGEAANPNSEIQSDVIGEAEVNPSNNSDSTSQSITDDAVEQNIEAPTEIDTATAAETATTEDTVAETTETDTVIQDAATEAEVDTATETTTTEDTVAETTEIETVDKDTITEESTTETDTDSVAEEELIDELAEEIEKNNAAAAEETEEESTAEEAEDTEEEVAESEEDYQDLGQEVDRIAYEVQVQESPTHVAIELQEELQLTQLMDSSGLQIYGQIPSVKEISARLAELGQQTGKNAAFINISLQSNQLESFVVLPNQSQSASRESSLVASTNLDKIDSSTVPQALTLRETIKDTSRKDIIATATKFREEVSDSSKLNQTSYINASQKLYQVLIEPIEAELEANNIDILVFSMDSGLRLLPLAALHNGEQFLIEKYAVATVPSFGLTDTRYVNLNQSSILAMGASEFAEQAALPTMPIELETIVSEPRHGEIFINEQFTIENFKAQNRRANPFPIVHLGTHAEFKAGSLNDSYIQFYDDQLKIPQLQDLSSELGWNSDATPIELLVLSACETALGDEEAELGFAGLAVQAGVKSALASLWYVSDVGTLALMGEFYDQLGGTLIKAEALRQTQLKMLQGNVKVNNKQVELSNGENLNLPSEFPDGTLTLDHPYFWSSFTLIGNWN